MFLRLEMSLDLEQLVICYPKQVALLQTIPETSSIASETKFLLGHKPAMTSNLDKGFNKEEMETLGKYGPSPPSEILEDHVNDEIDDHIDEYDAE